MRSPFDELGKPELENPLGEEVEGQFSCQHRGCYETAKTARYLADVEILTWICKEDHISSIEDFVMT